MAHKEGKAEKPADEVREHSKKFLQTAARMAEGRKSKRGESPRSGRR